jgi:enhancing lycopene biosynthesis protein 2
MKKNTKRIGVLLCGCGHRDGSEIHEATLTLLAIDLAGAKAACMAPTGVQRVVRDHVTGAETHERRDMRVESARISRGNIANLANVTAEDLDALVIPGGQGAALNLSSFLVQGPACTVHPELERLVGEMLEKRKPIGAICIAPATLARILDRAGVSAVLTCGTDAEVSGALEAMGQEHETCAAADCVVDQEHRIVTTPAYMNAKSIGEAWQGIKKLVDAVIDMA